VAGVSLRKVIKRFGAYQVIHGADLEVADGEFVVFVGPSGCGKSTLLRMIAGLEDITEGEVWIGGALVNDVEPAERGVAMVFQSYALYPHMSVEQNLSFGLRMTGNDKADTARRVKRTADILRIAPLLARKPRQLSGGQRQRVAIGRAIMREPRLFLFDEPLSNLDAELRVQMRVEISQLHKALGTTMIYVTHDQTEAMTLADRIVVLNAGCIEQIGAPLDLYDDPANRFVAGFVGSPKMNFMAAKVVEAGGGAATVELVNQGGVRLKKSLSEALPAIGSDIVLGVRPEHFRNASKGDCDIAIKVDVTEHLGSTSYVYANTGGGEQLVIESEESRHEPTSDRMSVSIKASKAFLFDVGGARLR
jgi:lactose/L-arabinose transport system ATP-binding protein